MRTPYNTDSHIIHVQSSQLTLFDIYWEQLRMLLTWELPLEVVGILLFRYVVNA